MSEAYGTIQNFNAAPPGEVTNLLADMFGSEPLAQSVNERRPFGSVEELQKTARVNLEAQSDAEVLEAINAHPAIGASVKAGSLSEKEQAAANTADAETQQALAQIRELAPQYGEKHGFNFLIKASGLTSQQILENLQSRLNNDSAEELQIARQHLAGINELRLAGLFDADAS